MQTSSTGARRVLVLATHPETAQAAWRRVARSGVDVRATTACEEFVRLLRAWRPTHVAVCLDADDTSAGVEPWMTVLPADALDREALGSLAFDIGLGAPSDAVAGTLEELDDALHLGHLSVAYQPKIDTRDGSVFALEALARWHRPGRTSVPPDDFVQLAEISGRIRRLTDAIFAQALTWFGRHLAETDVALCLNLSAQSLVDRALPERVELACDAVGLPPERLVVEVTETSVSADQVVAHTVLAALRARGMRVALDDFGAGHASMLQLARHPFTDLKVDRSLVAGATTSNDARTILAAIVALGSSLDLRVTAEGVEDDATARVLADLGYRYMQGHHLARPMAARSLLEWLGSGRPRVVHRPEVEPDSP